MNFTIPEGYLKDGDEVTIVVKMQRKKSSGEGEKSQKKDIETTLRASTSNNDVEFAVDVRETYEGSVADDGLQMCEEPPTHDDSEPNNSHKAPSLDITDTYESKNQTAEHLDDISFLDDLRKRQMEKEEKREKILCKNPSLIKCTHEQNAEFKCLAFSQNELEHSKHSTVHTRAESRDDNKCAFCGGLYGSDRKFKNHLMNYHGNFTFDEHQRFLSIYAPALLCKEDEVVEDGCNNDIKPTCQTIASLSEKSTSQSPEETEAVKEVFESFLNELRRKQQQREIELQQLALNDPNLVRCNYDENIEFKCLAHVGGDMNVHFMAHKRSKYLGVCSFCGASYGTPMQFKHHLKKHHGDFTIADSDKYKLYKSYQLAASSADKNEVLENSENSTAINISSNENHQSQVDECPIIFGNDPQKLSIGSIDSLESDIDELIHKFVNLSSVQSPTFVDAPTPEPQHININNKLIDNLRKKQLQREELVMKSVEGNPTFQRCTYNQNVEFKCLAFCADISVHLILHTRSKLPGDRECAFCGALYGISHKFTRHLENHHGLTRDDHQKYEIYLQNCEKSLTVISQHSDQSFPENERTRQEDLRQKLLKLHAASSIRFPPPDNGNPATRTFIDNLHQRQLKRELELKQTIDPKLIMCVYDRNNEFKCLAHVFEFNMAEHLSTHTRSQSEINNQICAFCGAVYGNINQLQNHLEKHHGNFTISENNEYQKLMESQHAQKSEELILAATSTSDSVNDSNLMETLSCLQEIEETQMEICQASTSSAFHRNDKLSIDELSTSDNDDNINLSTCSHACSKLSSSSISSSESERSPELEEKNLIEEPTKPLPISKFFRFPIATPKYNKFIDDLHKRQLQKAKEIEKSIEKNSGSVRCTYKPDLIFRCLAIAPNEKSLSDHSIVHTKKKMQGDKICAFCGALYGNRQKFRTHLKQHHGEFTGDENLKYEEFVQKRKDFGSSSSDEDDDDNQNQNQIPLLSSTATRSAARKERMKQNLINVVEDLRQRQCKKETEIRRIILNDKNMARCNQNQKAKFKCLALISGKVNIKTHLKAHTRAKFMKSNSDKDKVCIFCGIHYPHKSELRSHLKNHHGEFTLEECDAYRSFLHLNSREKNS